jgi:hypothetical protein
MMEESQMKAAILSVLAFGAMTSLALADDLKEPTRLSDQQLDQVVGGWCGASAFPGLFTSGGPTGTLFEGQPVYEVHEGQGSVHCALKPNGGIPIVIYTGHLGSGQVIVIGDRGAAR